MSIICIYAIYKKCIIHLVLSPEVMTKHSDDKYIYIYIYIYVFMVFITEEFFEVVIESWPEWDLNPRRLNSVQTL